MLLAGTQRLSAAESINQAADPLVWSQPAAPPAFRQVLHAAEYQPRFERALAELGDLKILAAVKGPPAGALVTSVKPGSAASQLGLQEGDTVVAIDGAQVWTAGIWSDRQTGPHELTVVNAAGERRSVRSPGDLSGSDVKLQWRPEQLFLQGKQRDARWEREALVGIVKRASDPDLAETAWNRAVAAGYVPDYLSAYCGAEIAMSQGRPAAALDYAWFARQADESRGELVQPDILYRVAIANYKLQQAAEMVRQFPGLVVVDPQSLQSLIAIHRSRPAAERLRPPPSQMAVSMCRRDLTEQMTPASPDTHVALVDPFRNGPLSISPPKGETATLARGPSAIWK